ncbi:MAG: hypothetical protein J5803_06060 [Desulfovibrio sp.]|nr:hypothetical protein [Desulfovibrio sp.]
MKTLTVERNQILRHEYISFIGNVEQFKYHLLSLAIHNGYGRYKETVIISDGATWIRNIKEEFFPDAQQVIDLFYLKESVCTFSKFIFNNDDLSYIKLSEEICSMLENGEYEKVLSKIEKYKNLKVRHVRVNLYGYILNNRNNIDYPQYKKKGFLLVVVP